MKIANPLVTPVLGVTLLSGYASVSEIYQSASAGPVGCPAGQISISERVVAGLVSGTTSWVATCGSNKYYCSGVLTESAAVANAACTKAK
jgi:hypothetical protein